MKNFRERREKPAGDPVVEAQEVLQREASKPSLFNLLTTQFLILLVHSGVFVLLK